jgi:exopolysaccharide production protein ExoQ
MNYLIASVTWGLAIWLIRRDTARREGISFALWVPTLWAGILLSRPLTVWLGFGGGTSTMEGSPLDRAFYFGMILLALIILSKRKMNWTQLVFRNWSIFLFYGFLLVSVLWAESSFVSFKRWFKELGNIFVAAVILTEANPQEAFRAVFVRCAYLLLPLSEVFNRYFPALARSYSPGGGMQLTGVTTQKNSLGILVVICGLVLLWDWFERDRKTWRSRSKLERYSVLVLLPLGGYLLHQSSSQTSLILLILGAGIISAVRVPVLRQRIGALGAYTLAAALVFYALDSTIGIKEDLVGSLGRDMTFTGRTDVWRELLALQTDPLIGTGFCSIWSDKSYLSRLPVWVGASAHNGYLEMYIDGGMIGVFFLVVMLLAIAIKTNHHLKTGGNYAVVRFAFLAVMLIANYTESHFGRMSPLGFVFLVTALEVPSYRRVTPYRAAKPPELKSGRVVAAPLVSSPYA